MILLVGVIVAMHADGSAAAMDTAYGGMPGVIHSSGGGASGSRHRSVPGSLESDPASPYNWRDDTDSDPFEIVTHTYIPRVTHVGAGNGVRTRFKSKHNGPTGERLTLGGATDRPGQLRPFYRQQDSSSGQADDSIYDLDQIDEWPFWNTVFTTAKTTQPVPSLMEAKRDCFHKCQFRHVLPDAIALDQIDGRPYSDKMFDQKFVTQLCRSYTNQRECMRNCGVSEKLLDKQHSHFSFVCISHFQEFMDYIPCYRASNTTVMQQCYPKCGPPGVLQVLAKRIVEAKVDDNLNEMLNMLAEICGYTSCVIQCQTPIIRDSCRTSKPAELLLQFMNQSMEQNRQYFISANQPTLFPAVCQKFYLPADASETHRVGDGGFEDEVELLQTSSDAQKTAAKTAVESSSQSTLLLLVMLLTISALRHLRW